MSSSSTSAAPIPTPAAPTLFRRGQPPRDLGRRLEPRHVRAELPSAATYTAATTATSARSPRSSTGSPAMPGRSNRTAPGQMTLNGGDDSIDLGGNSSGSSCVAGDVNAMHNGSRERRQRRARSSDDLSTPGGRRRRQDLRRRYAERRRRHHHPGQLRSRRRRR